MADPVVEAGSGLLNVPLHQLGSCDLPSTTSLAIRANSLVHGTIVASPNVTGSCLDIVSSVPYLLTLKIPRRMVTPVQDLKK